MFDLVKSELKSERAEREREGVGEELTGQTQRTLRIAVLHLLHWGMV
jgi:hypothetical protein